MIDCVLAMNMMMQFCTAKIKDDEVIRENSVIVKMYLKSYFIFDLMSCIPGLLTVENYEPFYYFKIVRFIQIYRLFD
jgi:hypothetical protein